MTKWRIVIYLLRIVIYLLIISIYYYINDITTVQDIGIIIILCDKFLIFSIYILSLSFTIIAFFLNIFFPELLNYIVNLFIQKFAIQIQILQQVVQPVQQI